jgi:4'-phosphopantetheinyl transferase EntD
MLYLSGLVDVFARRYPAHYLDGIESIRFYERDMASAAYRCRCRVTEWRGRSFLNDIEGLDALGAVRVRVRGAVSTRAQEPVHEGIGKTVFEDFLCHPQRKAFARRLDLATPLGLTEVEIPLVANALNAAGPEEFLHTWLGPREREVFEDFKHPKRRSEWLAGRICAKEALRTLSEEAPGATDIEILTDTEGAPVVRYPGVLEGPRISIAHSKGLAVAAASDCASVGIDVEKVAYDVHRFQNKFCSVTEVRLVRDEAGELEVPTLMRLWVAKEAALKAARNGSVPLTSLCVQGVELDDLYVVVDLQGEDGTPVRAVTFRSHDYYYAVAAKTRDPQ